MDERNINNKKKKKKRDMNAIRIEEINKKMGIKMRWKKKNVCMIIITLTRYIYMSKAIMYTCTSC